MARQRAPALTPDQREQQMISMAVDLAEKKLMDGSASNQIILHYIRLATSREELEKKKLEREIALLEAKKVATEAAERIERMQEEAISAMRTYGRSINHLDDEDAILQ